MTRETEAMVLVFAGVALARVVYEGSYLHYVRAGLLVPLLLSVLVLVMVGALSLRRRQLESQPAPMAERPSVGEVLAPLGSQDHSHHGAGSIGLLLLVPIAVLVLVAPSSLGAFAAERGAANRSIETGPDWPELPVTASGIVDLPLSEILGRALSSGDPTSRVGRCGSQASSSPTTSSPMAGGSPASHSGVARPTRSR